MTSIYKTAYPYYSNKKKISDDILATDYQLTREELSMIKRRITDENSRLKYAVLLMVFKDLNYFPELKDISTEVIDHIKGQLQIPNAKFYAIHASVVSRHRQRVYDYFRITPWKTMKEKNSEKRTNPAKDFAVKIALEASKAHNYPADIINVVVEQMKKDHFELPRFNQLDRLVRHTRAVVNQKIFDSVYHSLSETQIEILDALLDTTSDYQRSDYNQLKASPKNPTISHFRELLKHHDWLISFSDVASPFKEIVPIKLKQFAEQARSLDASNLKDFSKPKRYTLMLSLVLHAQTHSKDALAITFCKTMAKMHKRAKEKLERLRDSYRTRTQELLHIFSDILSDFKIGRATLRLLRKVRKKIKNEGGAEVLQTDCEQAIAFNSNNYFYLLSHFYNKNNRRPLLNLLRTLDLQSSTQQDSLMKAIDYILDNSDKKSEYLPNKIDLSFTTDQWRKLILKKKDNTQWLHRRYLEICTLSHVANDLRSGDLFIVGADFYADYREELLSWSVCESMLDAYCQKVGIANSGPLCVRELKEKLTHKAQSVDRSYPTLTELVIDDAGNPTLKKHDPKKKPSSAVRLEKLIRSRMPERNLIDVLASSHFYCGWAHELGPISGDDPKIKDPFERYILTDFAYGTGMGPTQTEQHVRGSISAHMLSWINQRHVTAEMLDKARTRLINLINQFELLKSWGDGSSVAGDGTLQELREQSLIAEFHMRYRKKGGIAYHHVADNYILLFSTFMPCGVWEAVEIIEGLLKNDSNVQPDIIHGDTQSQSTIVFALAYLLGFRLMPRIRNWKDVKFFRPDKEAVYQHIDSLFNDTINWDLIEKHWQDMMQVVLSIREGKISSSKLLRKLGSYSRKNRLYQAFQELGYVIRTLFLLEYISDVELREIITARTNKVEAYNGLSGWCAFGSNILVASNDEVEMEKAVKYNDILTNAVMLQNVADMTDIMVDLKEEGYSVKKEDTAYFSPYWTKHLKRFGDIVMDLNNIPKSVEVSRRRTLW